MPNLPSEPVLVQRRLHWGIFVIPAAVCVVVLVMMLPLVIIFHFMQNTMQQFNLQAARPFGGSLILLVALPPVMVVVSLLLIVWFAYLKSIVILTERRLIYRTGLLSRVTGELPLNNVDAIILAEPLLGRLLGYGTVIVTSVGGLTFPFHYVPRPAEFHALLQDAVKYSRLPLQHASKLPSPPKGDDSRYMPRTT
jgi:uncharacterized membrane protein YdbT with pleckstrin-like domain